MMSTQTFGLDENPTKNLFLAAKFDNQKKLLNFLSEEDNLQYIDTFDSSGYTAVQLAAKCGSLECLRILLNRGANPNIRDEVDGKTALHFAVEEENEDMVEVLINLDADPSAKDKEGTTPLELAERHEFEDIVQLLQMRHDFQEKELDNLKKEFSDAVLANDVQSAANYAQQIPGSAIASFISDYAGGVASLLYRVCSDGQLKMAELLLGYQGVDPTVADPFTGWLPIHTACRCLAPDTQALVTLLMLRAPETICCKTNDGMLPLHIAAESSNHEVVLALLDHPFKDNELGENDYLAPGGYNYSFAYDLNCRDNQKRTPLLCACVAGHKKSVEAMLNFKVQGTRMEGVCKFTGDEEEEDIEGLGMRRNCSFYQNEAEICPFDLQCVGWSVLHEVIKGRSKESDRDRRRWFLEIAEMLLKCGLDVNKEVVEEDESKGALMIASENCDLKMMDILLQYGACDPEKQVLKRATFLKHERMIGVYLKYKTYHDTRNRINKNKMRKEGDVSDDISSSDFRYAAKFPTKAVSINWQGLLLNMDKISEDWLHDACLHHNDYLEKSRSFAYYAITQIDISENSLLELPAELFRLPSMRILNASCNEITALPETLKDYLYYPEAMEGLQIQQNNIESLPVWLFHPKLSKLAYLNASHNKISSLPKEIWHSPRLLELILASNQLSSLPFMSVLGDMQESEVSDIMSVGITKPVSLESSSETNPDDASALQQSEVPIKEDEVDGGSDEEQNFTRYMLWQDKVKDLDDSLDAISADLELKESRLRELNLSNNLFQSVPKQLPCLAPKLEKLTLSGNQIIDMGLPHDYPRHLKVLNLSSNQILGFGNGSEDPLDGVICYHHVGSFRRKSTFRKKGRTGSTVGRKDLPAALPPCSHRQHKYFDSLHTLYLANNDLSTLSLIKLGKESEEPSLNDKDVPQTEMGLGRSPSSRKIGKEASDTRPASFTSSLEDEPKTTSILIFPRLSTLDISNNRIETIPVEIAKMEDLTQLIMKKNKIKSLPSALGNLKKLWNLDLLDCPLEGHLQQLRAKNVTATDMLGYLKSKQDKMEEYNRLKLMVVGVEGIGKSLMLKNLCKHEKNPRVEQKTRLQRLGQVDPRKGPQKSNKYVPTEGVDIQQLVMTRNKETIVFKTWDFGGKREYYATHQYFLSRRALYLVVWNLEHEETGIKGLHQWLVNIQARAPDSYVIIVGTHYDHVRKQQPKDYVQTMKKIIRKRFIDISEKPTHGLPNVLDQIEISNTSMFDNNIGKLATLIFKTALDLEDTSTKRPLVKLEIPNRYLVLEEIVKELATEKQSAREAPVLTTKHYNYEVMEKMRLRHQTFVSQNELKQATQFLHENGVLLHYEDTTLQHLYFLEPQWLCDMLTSVIEDEDQSSPKTGQVRIGELKHRFRNSPYKHKEVEEYIINLLNKFELGLQYDEENLIIPQLLPTEKQLREKQPNVKEVWIPLKKGSILDKRESEYSGATSSPVPVSLPPYPMLSSRLSASSFVSTGSRPSSTTSLSPASSPAQARRARLSSDDTTFGRSTFYLPTPSAAPPPTCSPREEQPSTLSQVSICKSVDIKPEANVSQSLRRLYLMSYFPSGFWARLITRLLADSTMRQVILDMYPVPSEVINNPDVTSLLDRPEWLCYQTGIELLFMKSHVLLVREITEETTNLPCEYCKCSLLLQQEGDWRPLKLKHLSILEVLLPNHNMEFNITVLENAHVEVAHSLKVSCNLRAATKLLATVITHIDNLLEDWYPDMGLRFAQNFQGMFLITRVIPCMKCFIQQTEQQTRLSSDNEGWSQVFTKNGVAFVSDCYSHTTNSSLLPDEQTSADDVKLVISPESEAIYCFTVEECMLATQQKQTINCKRHGQICAPNPGSSEYHLAPDVLFQDLDEHMLINQRNITRSHYLGRGAFSSVFKGIYKSQNKTERVAIKVLEPIKPGNEANSADLENYEHNLKKWDQDPTQAACKAYLIARQECSIMFSLHHRHIVQLLGISLQPLSLILEVAPLGELCTRLKEYRKNGARLPIHCIKKIVLQTASALHYLHSNNIIHRDLKSDNIMVWSLPPPRNDDPGQPVEVKLADYGISRAVLPTGGKGYAGTPGFVAPEIIQFMGEQSYTEKVDCFAFGMLMYELLTLQRPLKDKLSNAANWKNIILNNNRPVLRKKDVAFYPTHFLDLMVTCWEQDPSDRPSAEEIIAIALTPEFCHLRHAISPTMRQDVTCAVSVKAETSAQDLLIDFEDYIPETEVWLSCGFLGHAMLEVITYEDECPVRSKSIALKEPSSMLVMCPVGSYMWCGDNRGYITVISRQTWEQTLHFHICESPVVTIVGILYLQQNNQILVTLSNGRLKLMENSPTDEVELNIEQYHGNGKKVNCAAVLQVGGRDELWCGQHAGSMAVWVYDCFEKDPDILDHVESPSYEVNTWIMVTSPNDKKSIWTYIYPGSTVYLWHVEERKIKKTLDVKRIIPCADQYQRQLIKQGALIAVKCQITAMNVIYDELYIGTTWGVIIVVDKNTMHHLTSFRCHEQDEFFVKAILPLTFEDIFPPMLDPSLCSQPVVQHPVHKNIVTIGRGYRNVMKSVTSCASLRRTSLNRRTFLLSFLAEDWKYY